MDGLACIGRGREKKTHVWAMAEARTCLCWTSKPVWDAIKICLRVRVSSLGIKINVFHLSIPLLR